MDEKKKLPLWLKGVMAIAIAGTGFSVLANIGKSLVKSFVAQKLEEKGIPVGKDLKNVDVDKIQKALEDGFKKSGIPINLNLKTGGIAVKDEKTGQTLFATKSTGDVPRDFPADIPIFQPSTVNTSMLMGPNKSLHLETTEPLEKVTEFYRKGMPERGWQEDQGTQVFGAMPAMTHWLKGQKQVSIVATPPENGKTLIIISINEQSGAPQAGTVPLQGMNEKEGKEMQQEMQKLQQMMNQLNTTKELPAPPAPQKQ